MNTENLNYAIEGQFAKHFMIPDNLNPDVFAQEWREPSVSAYEKLREFGIEETAVPQERIDDIHAFAQSLRKKGKRPRAIRRAVIKKFNISLLD